MTTKSTHPKSLQGAEMLRLAHDQLVPDPNNRDIAAEQAAGNDRWKQFVDSIRICGVLTPGIGVRRTDGKIDIVDGERRWRGSQEAGQPDMAWLVMPVGTPRADAVEAGLVANIHRREPGALDIARRLRELKNQFAETQEQIAQRTGIALHNVQQYLALFEASDQLLAFIESNDIVLRLANELIRFERRFGEIPTRRLLAEHAKEPLTIRRVLQEKKRQEAERGAGQDEADKAPTPKPRGYQASLTKAFQKDPEATLAELQTVLATLGYRVVPVKSA